MRLAAPNESARAGPMLANVGEHHRLGNRHSRWACSHNLASPETCPRPPTSPLDPDQPGTARTCSIRTSSARTRQSEILLQRLNLILAARRARSGLRADCTGGSFAVRSGILLLRLCGCASEACVCRLQSRRADGFDRHRIVAAAAGVCRSTQTGLAAHSRRAPSVQTNSRSRLGCADAVRRARGA